ncbi:hypothetical protein [uncultured Pseudodesulfovibrio sp.]|uniref:hypothetical protein n=1 Tax=uncultured Pseudodesulfovibrio sp. TaxID=2035858 RepID=UPI0029C75058|nr:hypothetical protein [uncultured Pseudodesulfovibrio sp.]
MSLRFPNGRTVEQAKKDAKRLAKAKGIPLHEAQDRVAREYSGGIWATWADAVDSIRAGGNGAAGERKKVNALLHLIAWVAEDPEGRMFELDTGEQIMCAYALDQWGHVDDWSDSLAARNRMTAEQREALWLWREPEAAVAENVDFRARVVTETPVDELRRLLFMSPNAMAYTQGFIKTVVGGQVDLWHKRCLKQVPKDEFITQIVNEGLQGSDALETRWLQLCKQHMAKVGDPFPLIELDLMKREGFTNLAAHIEAGEEPIEDVQAWLTGDYDGLE